MLIDLGMFVLCTINGPCAWHQAIAEPFNNKNLYAKLICDFGVRVFYVYSAGLRVKEVQLRMIRIYT